jgi:hypothetical protein
MSVRACNWECEGGYFSIEIGRGPAELLISGSGWRSADTLYILRHALTPAAHDSIEWRVLELHEHAREGGPKDVALVVETAEKTYESEPGKFEGAVRISAWFVPKQLVAAPEQLEGKGLVDCESFLLCDAAAKTEAPTWWLIDPAGQAPSVPVRAIPGEARERLVVEAKRVASRAGVTLGAAPIAAAYHYDEGEPGSNRNNQTVACQWIWRLGFPVEGGGILTVQLVANGVDAREEDGLQNIDNGARAWLAFPGVAECVTWSFPGAPLDTGDEERL